MVDVGYLIDITKSFYSTVEEEFDQTRQNSWKGWNRILDSIYKDKDSQPIALIDFGCGNGRFLENILNDGRLNLASYLGIDSNFYLLKKAAEKFNTTMFCKVEFIQNDLIKNIDEVYGKFSVVAAFGMTHHIPSEALRKKWFDSFADKVSDNGFLIFSNWRIDLLDNFEEKIIKTNVELEENDFILGWGKSKAQRYVHIYEEGEMEKIEKALKEKGFEKIDTFFADGRNDKLNEYFIFKKC